MNLWRILGSIFFTKVYVKIIIYKVEAKKGKKVG